MMMIPGYLILALTALEATSAFTSPSFMASSSSLLQEKQEVAVHAHPENGEDRRGFLMQSGSVAAVAAVTAMNWGIVAPPALAVEAVDYKAVAADIVELVKSDPNKGPTLVRLSWHSSGTYDKISKTGGSYGGTIRFKEELIHGGNAGLGSTAVPWLEPIYEKFPGLSYADLYTLGGVASIKAMCGPTITWMSGRVDETDPASVTPDGRLPNADSGPPGADPSDADHLRTIFNRMGFNDQEIVALSGAHALGRCHTTASGYDGPWTPTPTTFNNAYFTLLSGLDWTKKDWSGPFQYANAGGTLMMLPSDLVLLQDDSFLKYVKIYAGDSKKFDKDFAAAFQKLEELGTKNLKNTEWA
eukprot:scaffold148694_cov60-Attheya_sp.AAC.2